jgi:hypothetical protein
MQYRIQFLDGEASVIRELSADARSAINALLLVGDLDWPPRAVTMRVLDAEGREVYSEVQGDASGARGLCPQMAALFVFDYLARLIIAPQPERANPAPRSVPLARGFLVWRLGGRFVWGAVVA